MKKILLVSLLLIQIGAYAQKKIAKNNFNIEVRNEEGDLNRDGLLDKALVYMDTTDATVPMKLLVYFGQPNKKFKLIMSSTKIIEPQYPANNNGKHSEFQIPNFFIEDGYLKMIHEVKGGMAEHRFKFQNGSFELIFVSKSTWDGKNTTTLTEFNLVTGLITTITQALGSEKILTSKKSKIVVRPLPKIQNFKPFEKEAY